MLVFLKYQALQGASHMFSIAVTNTWRQQLVNQSKSKSIPRTIQFRSWPSQCKMLANPKCYPILYVSQINDVKHHTNASLSKVLAIARCQPYILHCSKQNHGASHLSCQPIPKLVNPNNYQIQKAALANARCQQIQYASKLIFKPNSG